MFSINLSTVQCISATAPDTINPVCVLSVERVPAVKLAELKIILPIVWSNSNITRQPTAVRQNSSYQPMKQSLSLGSPNIVQYERALLSDNKVDLA